MVYKYGGMNRQMDLLSYTLTYTLWSLGWTDEPLILYIDLDIMEAWMDRWTSHPIHLLKYYSRRRH